MHNHAAKVELVGIIGSMTLKYHRPKTPTQFKNSIGAFSVPEII
jgi:hypothetical protein